MKRLAAIAAAFLKAVIFYGAFSLVFTELIAINLRVFPSVPWAFVISTVLFAGWIFTIGRKWSGYKLFAVAQRPAKLLEFVALSVLACLAALVFQGALFNLRIEALHLKVNASQAVAGSYSLLVPLLGAILEEISFRGILQGRLQAIVGVRTAAWTGGILFVALHGWNFAFMPLLGLYASVAIAASVAAARTQSVLPGLCIHASVNLILTLAPLVGGSLRLGQLPTWAVVGVALAGIVAALAARKSLQRIVNCRSLRK